MKLESGWPWLARRGEEREEELSSCSSRLAEHSRGPLWDDLNMMIIYFGDAFSAQQTRWRDGRVGYGTLSN